MLFLELDKNNFKYNYMFHTYVYTHIHKYPTHIFFKKAIHNRIFSEIAFEIQFLIYSLVLEKSFVEERIDKINK